MTATKAEMPPRLQRHLPAAGRAVGLRGTAICGRVADYYTGDHAHIVRLASRGASPLPSPGGGRGGRGSRPPRGGEGADAPLLPPVPRAPGGAPVSRRRWGARARRRS